MSFSLPSIGSHTPVTLKSFCIVVNQNPTVTTRRNC